ncbi:AbgT family transporter [Sporomusa aerivorans]|uniref:AbgT family transporter n=1 Tax=Sporomusa aerivorans TaxID=204936 RepID=UPI00352A33C4
MSAGTQPSLPIKEKRSYFQRFLDMVEIVGNKFPAPFILFAMLSVLVLIFSVVLEGTAVSIIDKTGKSVPVTVISLVNAEGFRYILENIVKNFVNFPPLGLVVTMMLAMGLAEATGLIGAVVRKVLLGVPSWAVTAAVFFMSIMAHLASDAAMVIMPATAAAIFASMGRNPILGMSVAFAATAAGFSANFVPTGTDALLSGITATAIGNIPQTASSPTHLLINYYFMSSSAVILTIVGTIVAEKVIAPRLADMSIDLSASKSDDENALTPAELKGLKYAGCTALVYFGLVLALTVPETGLLRNPTTRALVPNSPLLSGMIPLLFFFFVSTGTAFGIGKGLIRTSDDIPKYLLQGLNGAMSFIVTAFAAAQFIAWFNKTNLATVIAVKGAGLLQDIHFTGIPLIIAFIAVCAFVDLFMMSGSAKWLFMAPIFVPMFGLLGFQPALTQAAYRVGESCLNGISPLNYYMPVILGIMAKYTKNADAGMGTLMATQIPYAFSFLVVWTLWLLVFMFLDLPLGPGASIFIK